MESRAPLCIVLGPKSWRIVLPVPTPPPQQPKLGIPDIWEGGLSLCWGCVPPPHPPSTPVFEGCPRPASVNLLPAPCLAHTQLLPPDPLQGCEFGLLPGAQAFLGTAGSFGPEGAREQKLLSCSSGERGMLGRAPGPHHHGDHHGPSQHAAHTAPSGEVGLILASDGVRGCRGG